MEWFLIGLLLVVAILTAVLTLATSLPVLWCAAAAVFTVAVLIAMAAAVMAAVGG